MVIKMFFWEFDTSLHDRWGYALLNGRSHSCGCARVVSEETRQKLSDARVGQTHTEESKRKISETQSKTWAIRKDNQPGK